MLKNRLKRQLSHVPASVLSVDHQRLIALINSMSDCVLAVSPSGIVTLTNGAALDLFDSNTLVGKKLSEFINLIDKHGKKIDPTVLLKNKAGLNSRNFRHRYDDGSLISLEINCSPVYFGYGHSGGDFVVLIRDITTSKSLEEEREEFISVASHELRTPIAIAEANIGNTMVLAEKQNIPESMAQALEAAHDQIIFLSTLINDLSMLSRAERRVPATEIKKVSIAKLFDSLAETYSSKATQNKLKLSFKLQRPDLRISTNELYLKEILQNLITNALKYTPRGSIEISASATGSQIKFRVVDTGIGIGKSEQKKVFSKFFRSEDSRVRNFSGTGLGLYISTKLAKLIGGNLMFESELNMGSSFELTLPQKIGS